jgi:streptogramin lyase
MRLPFLLLSALLVLPAYAGTEIDEWTVPWDNTRPRDPYLAPDGKVWFVGQAGHYVARLDPESGEFRRYDLPDGTGPHTVIVDDRGRPWYAGNRDRHIGLIDPESGAITRIDMPEGAHDPHTMDFDGRGGIRNGRCPRRVQAPTPWPWTFATASGPSKPWSDPIA